MDSASLSHTIWKCQYHIMFIPKYRRKVIYGQVKADIREIIKKLCEYKKVESSNS
jgi:putative transposase